MYVISMNILFETICPYLKLRYYQYKLLSIIRTTEYSIIMLGGKLCLVLYLIRRKSLRKV